MSYKSAKASVVGALIAVLAAFGFASTANAAPNLINPTALSSATIGTSGTNSTPITVTSTVATGGSAKSLKVTLPSGWSFVTLPNTCAATVSYSASAGVINSCFVTDGNPAYWIYLSNGSGTWAAGDQVSLTFAQGVLNVTTSRAFSVTFSDIADQPVDVGSATLAVGTNRTVTFDSNGGAGTTAAQTSLAPFALTANGFTKTGSDFTGWNTAADGSGTSYADTAFYPFTADATLYAQWTGGSGGGSSPTESAAPRQLANTGFDGATYLFSGSMLALLGLAALLLIARRRQI